MANDALDAKFSERARARAEGVGRNDPSDRSRNRLARVLFLSAHPLKPFEEAHSGP
jgi:hypothetical protein